MHHSGSYLKGQKISATNTCLDLSNKLVSDTKDKMQKLFNEKIRSIEESQLKMQRMMPKRDTPDVFSLEAYQRATQPRFAKNNSQNLAKAKPM